MKMLKLFPIVIIFVHALAFAAFSAMPPQSIVPQDNTAEAVYVMTSGGFTAAYKHLGPKFTAKTGIRLITAYGASGGGASDSIPERLKRGEHADIVILSRKGLDRLITNGFVIKETDTDLVRSAIGAAVRTGSKPPNISTVTAFKQALHTAKSIGYSASASGTYLSKTLFPKMGIWSNISHKSKRVVSERVGAVIARGDVEIGFQQISELLPIKGITYIGPIPSELQKITIFSTAITTHANQGVAQRLIAFLSSCAAVTDIEKTGLGAIAKQACLQK